MSFVDRLIAPLRLVRTARQGRSVWSEYLLSSSGPADLAEIRRLPRVLRVVSWRRVWRQAGTHEAREYALCELAELRSTPRGLTAYLWKCVDDQRFSSAANLLSACEPVLSETTTRQLLGLLAERSPVSDRREIAMTLLCCGRRTLRMQTLLATSGIWDWRRLIPREAGAVPITLCLPPKWRLQCDRCVRFGVPPKLVVGPKGTICWACLSKLESHAPGEPECLLCGHAGSALCAVCEPQVRSLLARTPGPAQPPCGSV